MLDQFRATLQAATNEQGNVELTQAVAKELEQLVIGVTSSA